MDIQFAMLAPTIEDSLFANFLLQLLIPQWASSVEARDRPWVCVSLPSATELRAVAPDATHGAGASSRDRARKSRPLLYLPRSIESTS